MCPACLRGTAGSPLSSPAARARVISSRKAVRLAAMPTLFSASDIRRAGGFRDREPEHGDYSGITDLPQEIASERSQRQRQRLAVVRLQRLFFAAISRAWWSPISGLCAETSTSGLFLRRLSPAAKIPFQTR
jgi:hypothetical protein